MRIRCSILLGIAVFTGAVTLATPSISIDSVRQRFPWNGIVDVGFTISGIESNRLYSLSFAVRANGVTTNVTMTTRPWLAEHSDWRFVDGSYESSFDLSAAFPDSVARKARVTGVIADEGALSWPGDATGEAIGIIGDMMVVDVSGGSSAAEYPVSYYYGVDVGRFNCDLYKTEMIVLKRIPSGTFTMGSSAAEQTWRPNSYFASEPLHQVTLSTDFYMGVFPVTQRQWLRVMGSNPSSFSGNSDAATCPAEGMSYRTIRGSSDGCNTSLMGSSAVIGSVDANSFMGLLRSRAGVEGFDLPTEAQWEYAARAGTTNATYIGENTVANVNKIAWSGSNSSGRTHGVGQLLPNAWGLYDTLGNVWEWMRDRASGLNTEAVVDPICTSASTVVLHGCGWYYGATAQRCAARHTYNGTGNTDNTIGLRLSVTLPRE